MTSKEEFKKRLFEVYDQRALSNPSSVNVNTGYRVYEAFVRNDFVLMPVVQTDWFYMDAPYILCNNSTRVTPKIYNPDSLEDYHNFVYVTEYNKKSYLVQSLVPKGKGLYARLDDLLRMGLIKVHGQHLIEVPQFYGSSTPTPGKTYLRSQMCIVLKHL